MDLFSEIQKRRAANAKKIAGFGVPATITATGSLKVIRSGSAVTLYTVGYERRDSEDLISVLRDQGIKAIADIRERPISRKAEFRAEPLRLACNAVGIEYQSWPMLGSTIEQRDELQATGDFKRFAHRFRQHAAQTMKADLTRLSKSISRIPTALLCYERLHEDCHRSVVAELVAAYVDATILAIQ